MVERLIKSAVILIDMVVVQNLFAPFGCVLGKTLSPAWRSWQVVLNFNHIFIKLNSQNKKFQPNSNILASGGGGGGFTRPIPGDGGADQLRGVPIIGRLPNPTDGTRGPEWRSGRIWPDACGPVQGSPARDEKGPVIQNHSCCMKESRLDQLCGDKCQGECCARCSVNESTASEARESKLFRRYWRDLTLKETRWDTASPTSVEG